MRYLLQDLLNARQHREDAAQDGVTLARRRLAQAEQDVETRKRDLVEYRAWRINREEELWSEILNKPVHLRNIDDLKVDIQLLREKELVYEQRILEAEKAVADCRDDVKKAEAALQKAARERRKLDEHKNLWVTEMLSEAERNVEKEMEDFRSLTAEANENEAGNEEDEDIEAGERGT